MLFVCTRWMILQLRQLPAKTGGILKTCLIITSWVSTLLLRTEIEQKCVWWFTDVFKGCNTHTHTRNVFPKLCKCLSLERLSHTKRFSAHALTQLSSEWRTFTSRYTLSLRQTPAICPSLSLSTVQPGTHSFELSQTLSLSLQFSQTLTLSNKH